MRWLEDRQRVQRGARSRLSKMFAPRAARSVMGRSSGPGPVIDEAIMSGLKWGPKRFDRNAC